MGRPYIDLTGQIINGIKVIGLADSNTEGNAGKHKKWKCICPYCNNEFIVASQHLRDKKKPIESCSNCLGKRKIKDLSGQKFGKLTAIRICENKTEAGRIQWICKCDCGNEIIVQSNHLVQHEITSCGCEVKPRGEELIESWLIDHNISYEIQKTFPNLKDKMNLSFDFYLPDYKIAIEYNGKQHYTPIDYFGGEASFSKQQLHDKIKADYCLTNNISLLIIPYNKTKDIDKILFNFIKLKR